MGFQQRMMSMMMGRKSPEDTRKMMGDMMPQMMEKMGTDQFERMMRDTMPRMMDSCFSSMDRERGEFMLRHCRGMLDEMEAKYLSDKT